MNYEPEPGMGFMPSAPTPKKRIVPDVAPNPAPVVNNHFNLFIDPQAATALQNALMWAAALVIVIILLRVLFFSR
jgi:hypothetical protein